ncbi:hypothetical protein FOA43_003258 [Brettanomyces nanus]|uniref:Peptide N-acetyl-beta-D-glucosaminyl asparaginase amidase A N-terminal domain-containing protein n=1 Tax=Eeniella nana TaxID=13502 RepID=A0A875S7F4_EENNA|nr:uncharacterized protein FOA43_003258 [Brettanomyces nanus]QPG75872.1 hypothetical protein FOA43_003258 [Brettanomyces nanus]
MKGSLAREWSLWNQLQQGYSKFTPEESEQEKELNPIELDADETVTFDEKHPLTYVHKDPPSTSDRHFKKFIKAVFILEFIGSLFALFGLLRTKTTFITPGSHQFSGDQTVIGTYGNDSKPVPHEFIEIPVLPALEYGSPVYQQSLLNATFENSWGHPAIIKYSPPPQGANFSQVVLTLDLWVDGVQFDRLFHVYIGGSEIWRSSTPEPAGKYSHTFSQKDVSVYHRLFRKDTKLMVQLDNLINSRLTGTFNISLNAFYYNNPRNASLIPHKHIEESETEPAQESDFFTNDVGDVVIPGLGDSVFYREEGASHVIPLVEAPDGRPPLIYYPDTDFKLSLPKLAKNTTKVKLMVYSSGNAGEEFWFSNLMEEFKDRFKNHGHTFGGHGPCRVINIYHDDVRIATANPLPVIFTGGLSPALWNPVVSTGSYDIKAIEFDITTILPYLWEDSIQLKIDVSNCLDDDLKLGEEPSGISSNWISSANLAVWENEYIADSSGEILSIDNTTKVSSFAFEPPFAGVLNQIVNAKFTNQIRTHFNYTLLNGTSIDFISENYKKVKQSNIQLVKSFGDKQKVISVPQSKASFAILDPLDNSTSFTFNTSKSFPLVFSLNTKPIVGSETEYQVNITKKASYKIGVNGTKILQLKAKENGTSNFTLSPNGNHGVGRVEHNYTVSNIHGHVYNRHALGDNGVLVYDNTTIINAPGTKRLEEVELDTSKLYSTSDRVAKLMKGLGAEAFDKLGFIEEDDPEFIQADTEALETFIEMTQQMLEENDGADEDLELSGTYNDGMGLFRPVLFDY